MEHVIGGDDQRVPCTVDDPENANLLMNPENRNQLIQGMQGVRENVNGGRPLTFTLCKLGVVHRLESGLRISRAKGSQIFKVLQQSLRTMLRLRMVAMVVVEIKYYGFGARNCCTNPYAVGRLIALCAFSGISLISVCIAVNHHKLPESQLRIWMGFSTGLCAVSLGFDLVDFFCSRRVDAMGVTSTLFSLVSLIVGIVQLSTHNKGIPPEVYPFLFSTMVCLASVTDVVFRQWDVQIKQW
ncbi:putative dolichyl pyrophosphate Man9GlcNAc2 alpha-1,3-glucosyltransferase-like protein [Corchorus capsularis]|uniref:Putative dolichyl pyrophosphate Man9GlcNAc2 alpha-1,3-glucosyltransferase-like protein n=1 Tax=Corchorus capsularis TaxID=210143 RepID=A0A1R3JHP4_COCAP|nr:putative dolichyl pyrophosphate Man9GlcNAc2 alpha-1,3-glucosyltransferase-like protein [Corchorus capsularis]